MKIARELELRLERLVDGLSATLFRGCMHPVDLANRLVRFIDLNVTNGKAGPEIANQYTVRMNPSEIEPSVDLVNLESELASAVTETAVTHGWRIGGPIKIKLSLDPKVATGGIRCTTKVAPGQLSAWCQLINSRSGIVHNIGDNRVMIGRDMDADVRIDHAKLSRWHCTLYRLEEKVWLRDVGSSNGTSINSIRLDPQREARLQTGDIISFGPATFSFRML